MSDTPALTTETQPSYREFWAPLDHVSKSADDPDIREVYGTVADPGVDVDKQRLDPAWLKGALPTWFETGANIREMHQNSAVGKGAELVQDGDRWLLRAIVVDPTAVKKIDYGVYNGFSVGVKWPRFVADSEAPLGKIAGGTIIEVSLADRPARSTTRFTLVKTAFLDESEPESATKAAIPHKDGETETAPAGYPTAASDYADPANKSWPLKPVGRIRAALAYYNGGKGKGPYSEAEWATVGRRIATAASTAFGKPYALDGGTISAAGSDATKAATAGVLNLLGKAAAADMVSALGLHELTDAQMALVAANIVRTIIVREVSEAGDDEPPLSYAIGSLAGTYDTLLAFSRGEVAEAWDDMADRILVQLAGLNQTAGKVAAPDLTKAGRTFSGVNMTHLQQAHDHLADATDGALCGTYADDKNAARMSGKAAGMADSGPTHGAMDTTHTHDHAANGVNPDDNDLHGHSHEDVAFGGKTATPDLTKFATVDQVTEAVKAAFAAQPVPDVEAVLKEALAPMTAQLAGLEERLHSVEERASDEGPLVAAATKAASVSTRSSRGTELRTEITRLRQMANAHGNPIVRADYTARATAMERELAALES